MSNYLRPTFFTRFNVNTDLTEDQFSPDSFTYDGKTIRESLEDLKVTMEVNPCENTVILSSKHHRVDLFEIRHVFRSVYARNPTFETSFCFTEEFHLNDESYIANCGWVDFRDNVFKITQFMKSDDTISVEG